MHVVNGPSPLSLHKKRLPLFERVERLRLTVGLAEKQWSEILGITVAEYAEFCQRRKDISIIALVRIADHLQLTLEAIMNDHVDYRIVAARYSGDLAILPERYQEGAGSRRRVSLNLLNAAEEFLGWRARAMVMRHLQVTEAAFADPDQLISLRFNTDLCEYLNKNYGGNHLFYQMGAFSLVNNLNTPIGAYMALSPSVKEAHSRFIEEVVPMHWEKNYSYKILKLTDSLCVAEGVPNPDVLDSLKVRHLGSAELCQTKVGIISAIPGYMGLPFSHAEEVKCVHRGDEKCVFEMDFEHAAQSFKFLTRHGSHSKIHAT